jgi:hypothetical protein
MTADSVTIRVTDLYIATDKHNYAQAIGVSATTVCLCPFALIPHHGLHARARTHTHTHRRARTHRHTYTHARARAHTHTHTHTHT